jgi:hypothetical protein
VPPVAKSQRARAFAKPSDRRWCCRFEAAESHGCPPRLSISVDQIASAPRFAPAPASTREDNQWHAVGSAREATCVATSQMVTASPNVDRRQRKPNAHRRVRQPEPQAGNARGSQQATEGSHHDHREPRFPRQKPTKATAVALAQQARSHPRCRSAKHHARFDETDHGCGDQRHRPQTPELQAMSTQRTPTNASTLPTVVQSTAAATSRVRIAAAGVMRWTQVRLCSLIVRVTRLCIVLRDSRADPSY